MSEYDNTNRGVLFKNDKKTTDTQPVYKGSINVDGQEYWLSAWIKQGQRGSFMTLAVNKKDAEYNAKPAAVDDNGNLADVPF